MIYRSLSSAELHLFRGEISEASGALWSEREAGFDPYYLAANIALRARIQLAGGDGQRALETVERWAAMASEFDRALPLAPTAADEALSLLPEATRSNIYRRFAAHLHDSDARFFETGSVNRVAGELALSLERLDEAEAQLRRAIDACQQFGCPVELGRSYAALATVSEANGDADGARELLDLAGELLSKHGAKLYLDQVIAKKEILKA
jgi:tetratricopeptide (TPR) repeat protein